MAENVKIMNFSGRLLIGVGTLPYVLIGIVLLNQFQIIGFFLTIIVLVSSTTFYKAYVSGASKEKQVKRFVMFISLPILLFIGVMCV